MPGENRVDHRVARFGVIAEHDHHLIALAPVVAVVVEEAHQQHW